jgi:hypothetical protein
MADHTFTFKEQQDLLTVILGDPQVSSEDMFPTAQRQMYLNRGELHFAQDSLCLREYATGTVSSQSITLPTNWLKTFVMVVNNQKADHLEVALHDYERYVNSGDMHWYQWDISDARYIKFLSSVADGYTYKLWYFKKPTTVLVNDADTSIIPIQYREASVYWAGWQLLQQIGKTDLANQAMQVYSAFVAQASQDSKEKYMDRTNPNVDTGDEASSQSSVDVEGRGYQY